MSFSDSDLASARASSDAPGIQHSDAQGPAAGETDVLELVAKALQGKVENLLPMTLQAKYFDLPEQKGPPKARPLFG